MSIRSSHDPRLTCPGPWGRTGRRPGRRPAPVSCCTRWSWLESLPPSRVSCPAQRRSPPGWVGHSRISGSRAPEEVNSEVREGGKEGDDLSEIWSSGQNIFLRQDVNPIKMIHFHFVLSQINSVQPLGLWLLFLPHLLVRSDPSCSPEQGSGCSSLVLMYQQFPIEGNIAAHYIFTFDLGWNFIKKFASLRTTSCVLINSLE